MDWLARPPPAPPTYLETDSARNAAFYAKMDFELIEQGHDDVLDISFSRMVHRTSPA